MTVEGTTTKETAPYCVATAQAVVNYIEGLHLITGNDVAVPDGLTTFVVGTTTSETWVHGSTVHEAGIVDVASNILLGQSNNLTVKVVPSVKAVYDFIHSSDLDVTGATEAGYGVFHQALATPDTLSFTTTGTAISGETISGGTPGTIHVLSNLLLAPTDIARSFSKTAVPSAEAVYKFVHNRGYGNQGTDTIARALATAGTLEEHSTEGTIDGYTIFTGMPGTCWLTSNIPQAATVSADILSVECVPNAGAVIDFVDGRIAARITTGVVGTLTVSGNSESIANIKDTTASEGYLWPVQNITMNATATYRDYSAHTAVPTVEAVIKYMHSITAAGIGQDDAKASISASTVTTTGGSTAALVAGATPGTFFVTGDITALGSTVTAWSGDEPVPTALAVATYVRGYTATIGGMTINQDHSITKSGCVAGMVDAVDDIKVYNTARTSTTYTEITANSAIPTASAIIDFYKASDGGMAVVNVLKQAKTTVNGVTNTLTPSVSSMGKPGTVDVADHIYWHKAAGSAPDSIFHGADMVPTLSAVAEYMDTYVPPDAVLGSMSVNAGGTATIANINASTAYAHGVVYVGSGVVSHTNKNVTGEIVPSLNAVYDFVHTANTSSYYKALATVHDIAVTTGTEAITGGTPGTLWLAGNIVIGTDGAYSTNAAASVKAVYDFVHSMKTGTDPAGTGANIALATGSTITSPSGTGTGTQYVDLAAGATPGTCYTVNSMMGLKGTNVVLSTGYTVSGVVYLLQSVVPTVQAVKEYVDATAGKTAVLSYITVGTAETITAVSAEETADTGMVYAVDNIDRNTTVSSRAYSSKAVPTVDAVIRYIHGEAATSGSMNDAKATAGTVVLATGSTDTAMLSGGTPGTTYMVSDMTSAYGTTVWSGSEAVPTVAAVRDYVSTYGGGGAIAYYGDFAAIPNVSNTQVNVSSGIFWFGTHTGTVSASSFNYTSTTNAVLWAICSGSAGSYTGTLASAPSNGPYVESYPVAQIKGGTVYQCQYGPIRITGRWM